MERTAIPIIEMEPLSSMFILRSRLSNTNSDSYSSIARDGILVNYYIAFL